MKHHLILTTALCIGCGDNIQPQGPDAAPVGDAAMPDAMQPQCEYPEVMPTITHIPETGLVIREGEPLQPRNSYQRLRNADLYSFWTE